MNDTTIRGPERGNNNEISLKEFILRISGLWHSLLSKWVIILVFGLAGGALGFLYAYSKKPVYTATTTFVLDNGDRGNALGSLGGLAAMAGIDIGSESGLFQSDNIIQLYQSRSMITKTLLSKVPVNGKKEMLINRYIDYNKLRDKWKESPQLKKLQFDTPTFSRVQDSIMAMCVNDIAKNNLQVSKSDQSNGIIQVEVKSNDEIFAKTFNDQIVENVNKFYIQTKTKKSTENLAILQEKTDSVRAVMNGAIYSAAAIADATPNLNPSRLAQRVAPIQRSQFNAETNKAILTELVKNLEMAKINVMRETPLIQVIDQPIYPLDKKGFGKAKGIVIGGFLMGFLICLLLVLSRMTQNILAK